MGSKWYLFKFQIKYGKELRYLNTKGKYGKIRDTEIKWLIISNSEMIIFFVEFIDQLIDYRINCASLRLYTVNNTLGYIKQKSVYEHVQNEQIQIILHKCKVSSQQFLSVVSNDSVSRQWRLWSDCADVQADLSFQSAYAQRRVSTP